MSKQLILEALYLGLEQVVGFNTEQDQKGKKDEENKEKKKTCSLH